MGDATKARWIAWGLVGLVGGCASALPRFSGGSTTPRFRTDVALGGAARVPVGALRSRDGVDAMMSRYRDAARAGGVVPVAMVRHGVHRKADVGMMLSGTTLQLEARGERVIREASTRPAVVYGVAPFAGWIPDDDGQGAGYRLGFLVPVTYSIDFGGLYDVWLGGVAGAEFVAGDFATADSSSVGFVQESARATILRGGGVLGMAAGFRRIHALLEIMLGYERHFGEHGEVSLDRGGLVIVPAFGLRVRF